jgi:ribonuclease HI/pterin-4a-carbinolamine dehydratase
MWQTVDQKLYKKFTFNDFSEATAFINKVAAIADRMNHHPTIQNTYNSVELWLATHDAGDVVTDKDRDFARQVDALFSKPKPEEQTVLFPKEMKLYGDGGSRGNPGPSALGFVLMDMNDHVMFEKGAYLGITTNNQAEYQSLKQGMEEALRRGVRELHVYMDSLLVINQMKGIFKVKNRDLWPIHSAIKEMEPQFKKVNYTHVPRELNKLADSEVNKCLDGEADN